MKKIANQRNLFIASFIILLISFSIFWKMNSLNDNNFLFQKCNEKDMIWDKEIYSINKINGKDIVLKVENRNKDAWYTTLVPIQTPGQHFTTCVRGVEKYPKDTENSEAGKELKQRSKGLEVSIGIQTGSQYMPIAHLTFNIRLFSNISSRDSYNLDSLVQNIAENFSVIQKPDQNIHMIFQVPVQNKKESEIPYNYDLVRLNGEEIPINSKIEFTSKDKGETWITNLYSQ